MLRSFILALVFCFATTAMASVWKDLERAFDEAEPFDASVLKGDEIWRGGVAFSFDKKEFNPDYLLGIIAETGGPRRNFNTVFGLFELKTIVYPAPQKRDPDTILRTVMNYHGNGSHYAKLKKGSLVLKVPNYDQEYHLRAGEGENGEPVLLLKIEYYRGDKEGKVATYGYFDRVKYREGGKKDRGAKVSDKK